MTPFAICLTTSVGCLISGLLPIGSTDLLVITAAATLPSHVLLPLIVIASTTDMIAKSVVYFAAAGVVSLPHGPLSGRIRTTMARVPQNQRASGAVLFASATTGFPPFYVSSVVSGALNVPFVRFLLIGIAGRSVRFAVLVTMPLVAKHLF